MLVGKRGARPGAERRRLSVQRRKEPLSKKGTFILEAVSPLAPVRPLWLPPYLRSTGQTRPKWPSAVSRLRLLKGRKFVCSPEAAAKHPISHLVPHPQPAPSIAPSCCYCCLCRASLEPVLVILSSPPLTVFFRHVVCSPRWLPQLPKALHRLVLPISPTSDTRLSRSVVLASLSWYAVPDL